MAVSSRGFKLSIRDWSNQTRNAAMLYIPLQTQQTRRLTSAQRVGEDLEDTYEVSGVEVTARNDSDQTALGITVGDGVLMQDIPTSGVANVETSYRSTVATKRITSKQAAGTDLTRRATDTDAGTLNTAHGCGIPVIHPT
eukprot:6485492-Amphidinium_carterae.1